MNRHTVLAATEQASTLLWGAFITLLLLTQFERGSFLAESGMVLLVLLPLMGVKLGMRVRKHSGTLFRGLLEVSIHSKLEALSFAAFGGMYVAQYAFHVDELEGWTFIPVIIFFVAGWSADRESGHGVGYSSSTAHQTGL